jgi:tRNA A22 N-methylase
MADREKVAEDAHQCFYCTDFAYLGMVQCKHHKNHYCVMHQVMCGCPRENLTLVYRFTTKELERLDRLITDSCK